MSCDANKKLFSGEKTRIKNKKVNADNTSIEAEEMLIDESIPWLEIA